LLYIKDRAGKLLEASAGAFPADFAGPVVRCGPAANEAVVYGTIKKIIKDKGFGFIIPDDSGDEVFFHRSRLAPKVLFDDLREGNEVQFEVRPGEKGRQAFNLRLR
jgi:CspA family cold shock protein